MADSARTAAEIGVLSHGRLLAGGRDWARRQELVEQLLSQDAAIRSVARDEVVDRGLLDEDGPVAVLLTHCTIAGTRSGSATPYCACQSASKTATS